MDNQVIKYCDKHRLRYEEVCKLCSAKPIELSKSQKRKKTWQIKQLRWEAAKKK